MQLWLNQESNQQTVNIKSKEVYLSQQTQTPITEVVRTEKVNWQYIQRGVRQQTIQQYPAQRIGIEQPSEKAVHYRAEHRHRTQRSTPSIREPRGRERAVWQSITQWSAVPPRAAVQEAKKLRSSKRPGHNGRHRWHSEWRRKPQKQAGEHCVPF